MSTLSMSTNNFSQSFFCFICLNDKESLIAAQQREYDNVTLLEMMRFLSFDTSCIEPDIPMFVCCTCQKRLRVAYDLKVLCAKNTAMVKRYLFYLKHFTHPSTFNTVHQPPVPPFSVPRELSPEIDIKKLEQDEVITVEVDVLDSDDEEPASMTVDQHVERTKYKAVPCEASNCLQVISRAIHQSEVYKSPVLSNRPEFNNRYRNLERLGPNNTVSCSAFRNKPNISEFVSTPSQFSRCSRDINESNVSETVETVYCATDDSRGYSKINIVSSSRILSNRPEFNIYRKSDSPNSVKINYDSNLSERPIEEDNHSRNSFNRISNEIPCVSEQTGGNASADPTLLPSDNENLPLLNEEISKNVIEHSGYSPREDSGVDSPVSSTSSTNISGADIVDNYKNESEEIREDKARNPDEETSTVDIVDDSTCESEAGQKRTLVEHTDTADNSEIETEGPIAIKKSKLDESGDVADNSTDMSEGFAVCEKSTTGMADASKDENAASTANGNIKLDENITGTETNLKKKPILDSASQANGKETFTTTATENMPKTVNKKQSKISPPAEAVNLDIFSAVKLRHRMKLSYNPVQTHQLYSARTLRKPKVPKMTFNVKRDRRAIEQMNSCRILLLKTADVEKKLLGNSEHYQPASERKESNSTEISAENMNLNVTTNENTGKNVEIIPETGNNLESTTENSAAVENIEPVINTSQEIQNFELMNTTIDVSDIEIKKEEIEMENNSEAAFQSDNMSVAELVSDGINKTADHEELVIKKEMTETISLVSECVDTIVKQETPSINIETDAGLDGDPKNDSHMDDKTDASNSEDEIKVEENNTEEMYVDSIKIEEEQADSSHVLPTSNNTESVQCPEDLIKSETPEDILFAGCSADPVTTHLTGTGAGSSNDTDLMQNGDTVVYSFTNAEFLADSVHNADDLIKSESDNDLESNSNLEQSHSPAVTETVDKPALSGQDGEQLQALNLSATDNCLKASYDANLLEEFGLSVSDDSLNPGNSSSELVLDTDYISPQPSTSYAVHPNSYQIPTSENDANNPVLDLTTKQHTVFPHEPVPWLPTAPSAVNFTLTPALNRNLKILSQTKLCDRFTGPASVHCTVGTPASINHIVRSPNEVTNEFRYNKRVNKKVLDFSCKEQPVGGIRLGTITQWTNPGCVTQVATAIDRLDLLQRVGGPGAVEPGGSTTKVTSVISPLVPVTSTLIVPRPIVVVGSNAAANLNRVSKQTAFNSQRTSAVQNFGTPVSVGPSNCTPTEQTHGSPEKPTSHLRVKQLHTMQQAIHRRASSLVKSAVCSAGKSTATLLYQSSVATANAKPDQHMTPDLVPLKSALEHFAGTTTVPSFACTQEPLYSSTSLRASDHITSIHLGTASPRNLMPSVSVDSSSSSAENLSLNHFESPQRRSVLSFASVGNHDQASSSILRHNLENLSLATKEQTPVTTLNLMHLESGADNATGSAIRVRATSKMCHETTFLSSVTTEPAKREAASSGSRDPDEDQAQDKNVPKKGTRHSCPTCNKSFSSAYILRKHALTHKNFYQCRLCSEKFAIKSHFKTHMLKHYGDNTTCEVCNKVLKSKHSLKTHYSRCHLDATRCKKCNITFASKEEFKVHTKNEHPNVQKVCPVCDKVFSVCQYKKHVQAHEHIFRCELCEKDFDSKLSLNRHNCIENFEKEFKCTKCDVEFYFERHLIRHMDTHAENYLKCPNCKKTFENKPSLKEHICLYRKEFHCPQCDRAFYFHINFRRHMLTHLKDFRRKRNDFVTTPSL